MAVGFLGTALYIPGGGTPTDQDFTNFYSSDSNIALAVILGVVLVAGCLCLVWFFNELRSRLPDGMLARTTHGIAMIGVVGLAVGAVLIVAPASVQMNSSTAPFVGIPIANTFAQAGIGAMVSVGIISLLVATILYSIALRRSSLVPSWLSIYGFVTAFLMLGSIIIVPAVFFPIWLIVLGLVGVRQRSGS
jgi:hypothetical protein